MRDSMVIYRSFFDAIFELEKEFSQKDALNLLRAIKNYSLDGIIDDDMDPVVKITFINIKPQIDANTKRYVDGKKGGRPKKTSGNTSEKPKVLDKKTSGYETKKPVVIENKTIGYENKNLRLSDEKPNVNVNVNVHDNLNENENFNLNKKSNSFSFEKIDNPQLLKLDDHEKKAATIVYQYFTNINFEADDYMVYSLEKIKKADIEISLPMQRLNRAFLTYIYTMNINNIQAVQMHIKSIIQTNGSYTSKFIIDKIIQQIHIATQNKYKRFYLENIKQ
jgi:hypothetical protein